MITVKCIKFPTWLYISRDNSVTASILWPCGTNTFPHSLTRCQGALWVFVCLCTLPGLSCWIIYHGADGCHGVCSAGESDMIDWSSCSTWLLLAHGKHTDSVCTSSSALACIYLVFDQTNLLKKITKSETVRWQFTFLY